MIITKNCEEVIPDPESGPYSEEVKTEYVDKDKDKDFEQILHEKYIYSNCIFFINKICVLINIVLIRTLTSSPWTLPDSQLCCVRLIKEILY